MMEFTFEDSPWEQYLRGLPRGHKLPAVQFLTLLEGADEEAVADAFDLLQEKKASLDLTTLPSMAVPSQSAARLRQEQQLANSRDLCAGLEENDPLRLYLEELAALPVQGDVRLLAEQYLAGDQDAAEKLTNLSLSRVVELAREFVGYGVLLMDLIQEGSLGLWQGIACYAEGDFEVHRDFWIRHHMTKAVICQALSGGIGQKLRQAMADYRDTDQRLLTELGRNPTVEEIAEAMHVTAEDALVYGDMLQNARQQAKIKESPQEELPQEEEQAVENTAYFQMRQRITELLSVLDEKNAKLLTLRYGLEGGLPLSPEDTGKKLGMTPDEVVAAEAAALAKLRTQYGDILCLRPILLRSTVLPAQANPPLPRLWQRNWAITMWTPVPFTAPWHTFWIFWVSAPRMWTAWSATSMS